MARRTSEKRVQKILGSQFIDGDILLPFIESAAITVDEISSHATSNGITLTTNQLEIIERWLSAHYYCMANPTADREAALDASITYSGKTDSGYAATRFGQTAIQLDKSGYLAQTSKGVIQVGVSWLGKPPSTQIKYTDRD